MMPKPTHHAPRSQMQSSAMPSKQSPPLPARVFQFDQELVNPTPVMRGRPPGSQPPNAITTGLFFCASWLVSPFSGSFFSFLCKPAFLFPSRCFGTCGLVVGIFVYFLRLAGRLVGDLVIHPGQAIGGLL